MLMDPSHQEPIDCQSLPVASCPYCEENLRSRQLSPSLVQFYCPRCGFEEAPDHLTLTVAAPLALPEETDSPVCRQTDPSPADSSTSAPPHDPDHPEQAAPPAPH